MRRKFPSFSPSFLSLYRFVYKSDQNFKIIHMSFQETDTEDSASSLSEVSSSDDHFDAMQLEIGSSDEEVIDDDMDSQAWNEIE
jgi:hypothetical protein